MECKNPELAKLILLSDREPDEKLPVEVHEHLATCSECVARRKRYESVLRQLKHLSIETLFAYDVGKLSSDQKAKANDHLKTCQTCVDELNQIRASFDALERDKLDIAVAVPGWAAEREQAFVTRLKSRLQDNGPLATEESAPEISSSQTRVSLRKFALVFVGLIVATVIMIIVVSVFRSSSTPELGTKENNGSNQNLTVHSTEASPSPTQSPNHSTNQTAQQPLGQPSPKSPEKSSQPDLDTQLIAIVIDPDRAAAGERQLISVTQPNLRFMISIPRSAVSRSFRFELIDEDKGTTVESPKTIISHLNAGHRRLTFDVPAKTVSNTFYTLRLTGIDKADKTPEVFTLYLKLDR